MKDYSNVLRPEDRTSIPVHHNVKKALDAAQPKGLHRHQWHEMVIRAGLKALKSGDAAA